jgi:threonine/homoserine/homoserine lactone efflux protein
VIDPRAFVLACVLLLATPGPTNTLLAVAGAVGGVRRSLPLLLAEVLGYLISIGTFVFLVGPALSSRPAVVLGLKLAAALYLIRSAFVLWREAGVVLAAPAIIPFRRVFLTTVLNPKALVFAFGILPRDLATSPAARLPYLAALALLINLVGASWIGVGALAARRSTSAASVGGAPFRRAGAVVLAGLAVFLSVNALRT